MVKPDQPKIQSEPSKSMPSPPPASSSSSSSSCRKKKYKGVRMRSWGSWVSEIRAPNQKTRIWLGSYSTPEAAARAYDAALLCLKGTSANLNFPVSSSMHIPDTVMSPKSIQRVAAAAANSYNIGGGVDASTTPPSPLPPSSSPSSSSVSSPLLASSPPSDQPDDDVSLLPSFGTYTAACEANIEAKAAMINSPWFDLDGLQSPRYTDLLFNAALFNPPAVDDFYEEADIGLWSFC
ncbi:ethylene-responsive transcription factor ERF014 [Malania oleifera]|uniref:ethylene-responsive transcription factor ERF014 n=1 Tax=Malania oleifera TaxID=397392 RepID=UPI0025AE1320|nr:ethylene-responsive transcription factor ERF014 [Malania oleifera]